MEAVKHSSAALWDRQSHLIGGFRMHLASDGHSDCIEHKELRIFGLYKTDSMGAATVMSTGT